VHVCLQAPSSRRQDSFFYFFKLKKRKHTALPASTYAFRP
jgi:hypothetical protein